MASSSDSHTYQSEFLGEIDITEYRTFCIFQFANKMGMDFLEAQIDFSSAASGPYRVSRDGMVGGVWKETMVAFGPATNKNHERSIPFGRLEHDRNLTYTAGDGADLQQLA